MGQVVPLFRDMYCQSCGKLIRRFRGNDPTLRTLEAMEREGRFRRICLACAREQAGEPEEPRRRRAVH
ncbi:MAG: hypothetical protein IRZ26_04590 [Clostridia bacterium]|nr:hypothetical protein [Clostridia bacterium]MCL6520875.1 hypothetical protein [Bacillota bacterium]